MIKIAFTLLLLISNAFSNDYKAFASKMNYELNYETALQKAKKQNKDLMVVMVANFCPWCVKFEKLILEKPKYDKKIKSKYIPVIINREENNFPKFLDTPIVPTIYFLDFKTQKIKHKVVGYNNRLDFLGIINE